MSSEAHIKQELECERDEQGQDVVAGPNTYQVQSTVADKLELRIEVTCVKAEPCELYADHEVKDELVLGPERPHRPGGYEGQGADFVVFERSNIVCTKSHHKTNSESSTQQDTNTKYSSKKNTYMCDICGKTYKRKHLLINHITKQHQTTKRFPNTKKLQLPHKMNMSLKKHKGPKPFSCETCRKEFSRSDNLKKHQHTHNGIKPYPCDVCSRRFAELRTLIRHQRIHTGDKPYSCKTCKKEFRQSSNLIVHERTHTGEKPFGCGECPKRFAIISDLKRHHRIHTGEKPFSCEICKKRFNVSSHLKRHKQIHLRLY